MRGIGGMSLVSGANLAVPVIPNGMKRNQNYRGPDGQVQWLEEEQGLGLCHNRLASRLKWLKHWCWEITVRMVRKSWRISYIGKDKFTI